MSVCAPPSDDINRSISSRASDRWLRTRDIISVVYKLKVKGTGRRLAPQKYHENGRLRPSSSVRRQAENASILQIPSSIRGQRIQTVIIGIIDDASSFKRQTLTTRIRQNISEQFEFLKIRASVLPRRSDDRRSEDVRYSLYVFVIRKIHA